MTPEEMLTKICNRNKEKLAALEGKEGIPENLIQAQRDIVARLEEILESMAE